jgi:hypothetical protein
MNDHILPCIDTKQNPLKIEHPLHSIHKQKYINNAKGTTLKSMAVGNQSPLHQYVRMSFNHKTVVFKKKTPCEDRYGRENVNPTQEYHSNHVVILKQSPRNSFHQRVNTEPNCSELRGCKSLLNTKVRKRLLF